MERQDFLLRSGYCIGLENWERVKKENADKLNIDNVKSNENSTAEI